ncbi:PREDICTED: kinesin-related protein 4 isoform X1 [Acromyrmex echinatior]|uniref:Centromere protein J n=1 Tax=Acromyrmex echinatior TaxID=103372 RepID=F4WNN3_ACREC|nr:PREDICTED: kinesin-related protein 4 isoform X1 [Acromyrmex echinatior]EGI64226.1 Centromere protein J [Acromyrmex echinatior]
MDVEASVAERLQKLKQWQIEQQEKLLKQQRMQREILSHEQDRIYKALGLPTHFDIIGNTEDTCVMQENEMNVKETMPDNASKLQYSAKNSDGILKTMNKRISTNAISAYKDYNQEQSDDSSDYISTVADKNKSSMKDYSSGALSQKKELSDSLIEGIKPLSLNDVSNNCVSIDDIPLPSSKKDFQTILEEKLWKESEIMSKAHTDTKIKTKKPFLKKGQGLSRFKMSANLRPSIAVTKRYNMSLSSNTQHIDRSNKCESSVARRHVSPKILDNVSIANGKRQLSLKTVPLPKIFNKSIISTNQVTHNVTSNGSKHLSETNISDCDSKAERELEEVRIFELLEEKAENSSFCSTSSTVLAFLQQSTPFKIKNKLSQTSESSVVASKKQQSGETSDMIEPIQQVAHARNLKSDVQCQVEQFEFHKHSHTNAATINRYGDITNTNIPKTTQNCFIPANQVLESNEAYIDHPENHDTSIITVMSNNDEERDISTRNECKLTYESEADVNHHVRFSEYNEYRTIDSTDVSDIVSNSSLNDYLEQQNWNDCSIDTLESCNVKKKLPFNYKEQIHTSPLNIISNKKTIDTPRQSSLQQDVTGYNKKDSYNHLTKTIHVLEEENALNYNDESSNKDTCYDNECTPIIEEIVQTSDEERSILSSSLSSSSSSDARELRTHKKKEYMLKSEPEKITEEIAKICSNVREVDCYLSEKHVNQMNISETDLLKNRLLELEKEIDIFRKESSALLFQRRKLQEEEIIRCKQYAEKEKDFEENRRRVENQLQEEKKKIAREKIAMENRIRDAQEKAKQSKMERQKAQNLQEQLEELRDELNIKESRWNAAESRYKSELRVLRVEISKLKQEVGNLQNIKRTNIRNLRRNTGQVITTAINQINKRVVVTPSNETSTKMRHDSSNTSSDTSTPDNDDKNEDKTRNESITKSIKVNDGFEQITSDVLTNKEKYKQVEIESQPKCNQKFMEENIAVKKRYLYENLLKDATSDLIENQNPFHTNQDVLSDAQPVVTQIHNLSAKGNGKSCSSSTNKNLRHTTVDVANDIEYYTNKSRELNQDSTENDIKIEKEIKKDRTLSFEKNLSSTLHPSASQNQIGKTSMDAVKQIQFPDGRIEYWYPNGNVKKIFPDQEVTKMIYYNGDVRETDKNKRIKYFYATTRTWHTTTSDGLEILEFPDGQVEKRMTDGTVEVLFPDGTVAQTFVNGDKVLILPNGQKEIHTKAHKRREYPDGTIKLIYADGTQETRYSSGRKRLKDKDGNLLMDSYDV